MSFTRRTIVALSLGPPLAWSLSGPAAALARRPLVIACGGGSGDAPDASAAAYELAIREGADFLAIDVTPSKDGALMALRDHELSSATDVQGRPEFADRRQSRFVDGRERSGWFAEDFTLSELKTLRLGAADPRRRGRSGPDAGRSILTFEDVVAIARAGSVRSARVVGVHATMLHTAYFARLDLDIEPRLATAIKVAGYNSPAAAMFVASPDPAALKTIVGLTRARRVLRLDGALPGSNGTPEVAASRAAAEAIAVPPALVLDLADAKTTPATRLVADAHAAGLEVQAWTDGYSVPFPPPPFKPGDARRLLAALFRGNCDAVAGASAAVIARARDEAARGAAA